LNGVFVAFEKVPLTVLLAGNQPRALQRRQMGRHRGLRQAAVLVKLPGANAVLGGVQLGGERGLRIFQQIEDFSAYWVCQRVYYFVEVDRNGGSAQ